ncbi:hypothetical protein M422DRAFT_33469 [Sphaerobolus stellatus SS14]|uniref:Uncharacterized protein n=1 Tax=Sphaerobolus stellatus (strain SS14) TaxID=990650 RepID=A0A0C9VK83_SPHS4|nr:hypothetical protein M422DRAFT_33469 [Sphaerobolus stellatus SS14]
MCHLDPAVDRCHAQPVPPESCRCTWRDSSMEFTECPDDALGAFPEPLFSNSQRTSRSLRSFYGLLHDAYRLDCV